MAVTTYVYFLALSDLLDWMVCLYLDLIEASVAYELLYFPEKLFDLALVSSLR